MRALSPTPRPAAVGDLLVVLVLACAPAALASSALRSAVQTADATTETTASAAPSRADTLRAVHLLERATFGPRPSDLAEVLRVGPEAWLDRQLQPDEIDDRALDAHLTAFAAIDMSVAELYRAYPPRRQLRDSLQLGDSISREARRELARRNPRRILDDLAAAKLQRAVHSERQLLEVMTDFWFDHFNVFFNNGRVRWLVSDYERSALRPHVFGTFEDLLVATASHPAMLVYLDNWRSRKPDPANGRGLNENYARELLELHTLGVGGGYTQQDVVEVARAFTGWTITQPRANARDDREESRVGDDGAERDSPASARATGGMRFVFRRAMHDTGEKVVLGEALPAGRGREDGLDVLRMLAHQPATARHVATKLVQHFVADEPPPALVDELAQLFLDTGGDLRAVTRALFTSEAFYSEGHRGAKVKRPFELVASALRVSGAEVEDRPRAVVGLLDRFHHLPYMERAPTGYPSSREEWVSSAAILSRMEFAFALAAAEVQGISPVAAELWERAEHAASKAELVASLAAHTMPGRDTRELEAIVTKDLEQQSISDPRALAARALALVLGSPEFQRR